MGWTKSGRQMEEDSGGWKGGEDLRVLNDLVIWSGKLMKVKTKVLLKSANEGGRNRRCQSWCGGWWKKRK